MRLLSRLPAGKPYKLLRPYKATLIGLTMSGGGGHGSTVRVGADPGPSLEVDPGHSLEVDLGPILKVGPEIGQ